MIDFLFLIPAGTPNNYLVCSPVYCQASSADMQAPQFAKPTEIVKSAWDTVISTQPRVTLRESDPHRMQFAYTQRSAIFRFPDYITVKFVAENEGQATRVLMYSKSKYGYSDLGVNKKRVSNWLDLLKVELERAI